MPATSREAAPESRPDHFPAIGGTITEFTSQQQVLARRFGLSQAVSAVVLALLRGESVV
jgi:hypothetical protein